MYAIEESVQKINGEVVETFQREICDGNTNLEIEAGTTGYKGGCCRNAGGRTYLSLLCLSGDFFFGPIKDDEGNGNPRNILTIFGGKSHEHYVEVSGQAICHDRSNQGLRRHAIHH